MDCKIYVGDLPRDASEKELERAFCYYGPLRSVWVARNPAGFAFVEFEDPRDAEDAVRALDGTNICGSRVRVEHSTGKVRPKPWMRGGRGPPRNRRPFHPEDRCFECGDRGHYAYDCSRYRRTGRSRSSRRRSRTFLLHKDVGKSASLHHDLRFHHPSLNNQLPPFCLIIGVDDSTTTLREVCQPGAA